MLKTFKRVSGNKDNIYDNLEKKKKSCSFEIWQNCWSECFKKYTKSPRRREVNRGAGGGSFQFFLNISKIIKVRKKSSITKLNYVKFPVKMCLTFLMFRKYRWVKNICAYHVSQSLFTSFENMRCSVLLNISKR